MLGAYPVGVPDEALKLGTYPVGVPDEAPELVVHVSLVAPHSSAGPSCISYSI
jgi:hypothetical protein